MFSYTIQLFRLLGIFFCSESIRSRFLRDNFVDCFDVVQPLEFKKTFDYFSYLQWLIHSTSPKLNFFPVVSKNGILFEKRALQNPPPNTKFERVLTSGSPEIKYPLHSALKLSCASLISLCEDITQQVDRTKCSKD